MRRRLMKLLRSADTYAADYPIQSNLTPRSTLRTPRNYPYPYLYNVANVTAREVYARLGVDGVGEALELSGTSDGKPVLLMRCRHCLRRTLGYCTRDGHQPPEWHEPLFLVLPDKRRFRLQFNCRDCEMLVFST